MLHVLRVFLCPATFLCVTRHWSGRVYVCVCPTKAPSPQVCVGLGSLCGAPQAQMGLKEEGISPATWEHLLSILQNMLLVGLWAIHLPHN